jgi:hypothetical protein
MNIKGPIHNCVKQLKIIVLYIAYWKAEHGEIPFTECKFILLVISPNSFLRLRNLLIWTAKNGVTY